MVQHVVAPGTTVPPAKPQLAAVGRVRQPAFGMLQMTKLGRPQVELLAQRKIFATHDCGTAPCAVSFFNALTTHLKYKP